MMSFRSSKMNINIHEKEEKISKAELHYSAHVSIILRPFKVAWIPSHSTPTMKPNIQVTEFQSEGYSLFSFCKDFFLIELPVFTTVYRNKFMFIKKNNKSRQNKFRNKNLWTTYI